MKLPHVYPTVVHTLADAAERAPQREALVCEDERLNYQEYLRCVAGFARELIGFGASGGRVAVVLGNSIDICIAMFAIHAARAQAVPLNPAYTERELCLIFEDAAPHAVIYADDKRTVIEAISDDLDIPHRIRIGGEAMLPTRKETERLLCVMPLFHVYAVAMCLRNMVYARGTLVILPHYKPETVFAVLESEQITILPAVRHCLQA